MKRREFIESIIVGGGILTFGCAAVAEPTTSNTQGAKKMPFQQPPLPFAMDAMKPFLSEEQLTYHYGKHHAAYFKNLNGLVEGKPEASLSLREVVVQAAPGPVFNNAAQAWNHSFYWDCLKPNGGGEPSGDLAAAIARDFGSVDAFRKAISEAGVKLFGSGWAWLAADAKGHLEIMPLGNADTPLKHDREPVLTIDVWEHAYYVDYRNDRAKYIDGYWNAVNWDFAAKCYAAAKK